MKIAIIVFLSFLLIACSEAQIEELAFRKTLEHDLAKLCGEDDKECINAVKTQTKECMVKCNWRKFLNNQDDEVELKRFTTEFYSCIVDSEGNPYFDPKS